MLALQLSTAACAGDFTLQFSTDAVQMGRPACISAKSLAFRWRSLPAPNRARARFLH